MAYGPNSNNPRERRAYADNKLAQLKQGKATYQETYEAVFAASKTRKGRESGYIQRLGAAGVVLVDWSGTSFNKSGIVQNNFGGYVMPREDAEHWAKLGRRIKFMDNRGDSIEDRALNAVVTEHNKRFDMGYEAIIFTKMSKGSYTDDYDASPGLGDIINPLEHEGVTPLIAANDDAVEARIAQLQ